MPAPCLNESPSEKEGKLPVILNDSSVSTLASMKVPPKRKGNSPLLSEFAESIIASMKVPPKRKGNSRVAAVSVMFTGLNESPSEKEGKSIV